MDEKATIKDRFNLFWYVVKFNYKFKVLVGLFNPLKAKSRIASFFGDVVFLLYYRNI